MFKRTWNWMCARPITIVISALLFIALVTCVSGARADRIDDIANLTPQQSCTIQTRLFYTGMGIRGKHGPDYDISEYMKFHQDMMQTRYPEWERYNDNEYEYIERIFLEGYKFANKYMVLMGTEELSKAYQQERSDQFFMSCIEQTASQPSLDPVQEMRFIKVQGQHFNPQYSYDTLSDQAIGCVVHNMPMYYNSCFQEAVDKCIQENFTAVQSEADTGKLVKGCMAKVQASDTASVCKEQAKVKAIECMNLCVSDIDSTIPNEPKGGSIVD